MIYYISRHIAYEIQTTITHNQTTALKLDEILKTWILVLVVPFLSSLSQKQKEIEKICQHITGSSQHH